MDCTRKTSCIMIILFSLDLHHNFCFIHWSCLDEILTKDTTDSCVLAKLPYARFFVHQLIDSYWLVSLNQSRDCIKMPLQLDADTASRSKLIMNNIHIRLPPVALVSVLPMTTIICEGFSLVGRPFSNTNSGIVFILNGTMRRADIEIFNISMNLDENRNMKQFNAKSINDVLSFIEKTPSTPPFISSYFSFTDSIWNTVALYTSIGISTIIVIFITLICCYKRSRLCSYFLNRIEKDCSVEIDLQQYDHYSADQLKRYYDRIKLPKY